jgi:chondroitin AC lyase
MIATCMGERTMLTILAVITVLLVGSTALGQPAAGSAPASDLQRIKGRLIERRLGSGPEDANRVEALAASMKPDGSWGDIDYTDQGSAGFRPVAHVQRLVAMARACAQAGCRLHGDRTLRQRIAEGLAFWLTRDPKSTNWWWNEIGAPQGVADLLLLAETDLPVETRAGALKVLARSWPHPAPMTGENMVWVARIGLVRACLESDERMAKDAARAIASTTAITEQEGIQADFSFHQHGAQLYSGGYGMGFATDCADFAAIVQGTALALTQEQVQALSHYVLDGQQWMVRGGTFDPGAMGR